MNHLVIGGAGFIGVNLAAQLLADGESVTILDNFSRPGSADNVGWLEQRHPDVRVVSADIRSYSGVLRELVASADAVYHLAAQVAVTTSVADPRFDFEVNALGTLNVLEAARHSGADPVIVYASTNKVYGAMDDVPLSEGNSRYTYADGRLGVGEGQAVDFHSPYGCSKGAGDQYVHDYARVFGLKTVVLRQSCIYGPRQFGVEDQGWLAWFCIAAVTGQPIRLYGTGKQVRDLLDVADLVDLMRLAVEKSELARGQIYNVGGGPTRALSLVEAIAVLEKHLGFAIDYAFAPARPGDQRIYVSDIRKVCDDLAWRPQIELEDGIARLVEWITTNRELFVSAHADSVS